MKRFRLSTLLLLVIIAGLALTVVVQQRQVAGLRKRVFVKDVVIQEMIQRIRGYNGMLANLEFKLRAAGEAKKSEKSSH